MIILMIIAILLAAYILFPFVLVVLNSFQRTPFLGGLGFYN